MDQKTESDARYLEGGGLVLLSLILMFVAKWAFQKAALFDDGETVFPSNYPAYAWLACVASFLSACGVGVIFSTRTTRIANTIEAGLVGIAMCCIVIELGLSRESSGPGICITNMSTLGVALSQYATDNDDRLPRDKWMDRLTPYVDSSSGFRCPAVKAPGFGYAMRESLLGHKLKQIPKNEVLVYDSTSLGRNAVGDIRRDFAARHHDRGTVLFGDGHTDYKSAAAFSQ